MTITNPVPGTSISTAAFGIPVGNAIGAAWTDWSSSLTWLGSGSNPTKGNSTYVARYRYLNDHTVAWTIRIIVGSTFSAGVGNQTFSLPVTPADSEAYGATGIWWINDSAVKLTAGFWTIGGSQIQLFRQSSTGTTPWTAVNMQFADWSPNTNDEMKLSGIYEV